MLKMLLRTDASPAMGGGHMMRCLALAEESISRGFDTTLLTVFGLDSLIQRHKDEGVSVIRLAQEPGTQSDAHETIEVAHKINADWIVLDGYHFNSEYQYHLKSAGLKVLYLDDYNHQPVYHADVLLNQNPGAEAFRYISGQNTRCLLGPQYALLRKEFRDHPVALSRDKVDRKKNILITFGSSDAENLTTLAVKSLRGLNPSQNEAIIVVGAAFSCQRQLNAEMHSHPLSLNYLRDVKSMADLMKKSDLAITAGGSTCLELAYMGLPAISVITSQNQIRSVEALEKFGIIQSVGWWEGINADVISRKLVGLISDSITFKMMKEAGKTLVDGQGAKRVIDVLVAHL